MPFSVRGFAGFVLAAIVSAFVWAGPAAAGDVSDTDAKAVQSVIDGQIGAFRAHDDETAYSYAAPGIRQAFPTLQQFMAMVTSGYRPVYDPQSYHFGRNTEVDGQIHQEVLIVDKDGKAWQAVYTLKQQPDGSWKITGVKLNPARGESV